MFRKTIIAGIVVFAMAHAGLAQAAQSGAIRIAAGQKMSVRLETSLNTVTARKGDKVSFRIFEDVKVGDRVAIAKGSLVEGRVLSVGKSELQLSLDEVRLTAATSLRLSTSVIKVKRDKNGLTAGSVINGAWDGLGTAAKGTLEGTVVGGLLGSRARAGVRGGTSPATYGAYVGFGLSIAKIISKPRNGPDLDLPSGTVLESHLERALDIPNEAPAPESISPPEIRNTSTVRSEPLITSIATAAPKPMSLPITNPEPFGAFKLTVNVNLVEVHALVRDRSGRPMNNLRLEDFRLFEDGAERQIQSLTRDELPLAVALVIDRSGSVASFMNQIQHAAIQALRQLRPDDAVCLFSFAANVERLEDLTTDHQSVAARISTIRPGGGTDIDDAIKAATDYLAQTAPDRRRAVILISDNADGPHPPFKEEQALRRAIETETVVYSVKLGHSFTTTVPEVVAQIGSVRRITEGTGGEILDVGAVGSLDSAMALTVARLRLRYSLGYAASADTVSGTYHHIEVRLDDRFGKSQANYSVHSREGYYYSAKMTQTAGVP